MKTPTLLFFAAIAAQAQTTRPLPPGEAKAIVQTACLAKSFPEGNVPMPAIVPGPVKLSFKEWTVPTVGSRPHDPLATHDGYLWYTGQYANVLGRVALVTIVQ